MKKLTKQDVWKRIDQSAGPDACWPYTGIWTLKEKGRNVKWGGYGTLRWNNKQTTASRWVLEHIVGLDLTNKFACHTCDNPICCNPKHLYAGTPKDNAQDRVNRGRAFNGSIPKLNKEQSDYIKQHGRLGKTACGGNVKELAKQFSVGSEYIRRLISTQRSDRFTTR